MIKTTEILCASEMNITDKFIVELFLKIRYQRKAGHR